MLRMLREMPNVTSDMRGNMESIVTQEGGEGDSLVGAPIMENEPGGEDLLMILLSRFNKIALVFATVSTNI